MKALLAVAVSGMAATACTGDDSNVASEGGTADVAVSTEPVDAP